MIFPIKIRSVRSLVVFRQYYFFLLVEKSIDSLKEKTKNPDKENFFKKRKTNSRHAGIQSKIYQKK